MEEKEIVRGVFDKQVEIAYFAILLIAGVFVCYELGENFWKFAIIFGIIVLFKVLHTLWIYKNKELVVTDKRVYGKLTRKKTFSFEYSEIKSIDKINRIKQLIIVVESKSIVIDDLKNYGDVYNAIETKLEELNKKEESNNITNN